VVDDALIMASVVDVALMIPIVEFMPCEPVMAGDDVELVYIGPTVTPALFVVEWPKMLIIWLKANVFSAPLEDMDAEPVVPKLSARPGTEPEVVVLEPETDTMIGFETLTVVCKMTCACVTVCSVSVGIAAVEVDSVLEVMVVGGGGEYLVLVLAEDRVVVDWMVVDSARVDVWVEVDDETIVVAFKAEGDVEDSDRVVVDATVLDCALVRLLYAEVVDGTCIDDEVDAEDWGAGLKDTGATAALVAAQFVS
jgi:hypothetical protein